MDLMSRQTTLPLPHSELGVAWEEIDCPFCDGSRWQPLVEGPDADPSAQGLWFMVVQCQDCGLCFTNPRPCGHNVAQFYPPDYKPHQGDVETRPSSPWRSWLRGENLRQRIPRVGQGRLLDFGCGSGAFLQRMHHQGWKVTGLDISPAAVSFVRDHLGLNALVGTLPHPELNHFHFDVITMWQVLEHVHSPLQVLSEARKLLTPQGQLVVAVPNIDSLAFRWFGSYWNALDLPRHLTHFAPQSLEMMLHKAGFRSGPIRMVRRSGWLRASARLAYRLAPEAMGWRRWLGNKIPSQLASWFAYLTGQSDCMLVVAKKQ